MPVPACPIGSKKDESKPASGVIYRASLDESNLRVLKAWRRDFASRQQVAPYVILHDRTLAELLRRQPVTVEELLLVPGIGPQKAAKYGEDILDALFTALETQ